MKRYSVVCTLAVALLMVPANGQPDRSAEQDSRIPQLIAYQGKLSALTGRPVDDGSYVMVFSLYADSTGSSFWRETQTVETKGGLFHVLLGSNVPVAADDIRQGGCYLGIRVLPSTEEFRRQRIVSVPFALQADNADRLQGRDSAALDSVYVSHADTNAVTSALIEDGTITRADVTPGFRAPYADTANYARRGSDSVRVAGNAHRLQGKDTTRFVRTGQADAVTSAMIVSNTIVRADVATDFKAPFSDTADFARTAPAMDSARVAGNAHRLQTKDTTYFARATHVHPFVDSSRIAAGSHKLQGKDTTALWNAKRLQGKDTTAFVRTGQGNSVTGAMVVDGTIARADVAGGFKSPFSDTADYARAAPATDSARVAGNAHRLQTRDTTYFAKATHAHPFVDSARVAVSSYDSRLLQGKDTTALDGRYVNEAQANSVTGAMLVDATVRTADVGDTAVTMAKLARAGATAGEVIKWTGATWEPGPDNTGGGTGVTDVYQAAGIICTPNPITSTGTVGFDSTWGGSHYVNEGQTGSITSAMIVDGTVARADVATGFKAPYCDTADYAISAPASDSARIAGNAHLLQGKDTTGFVRTDQADAVTSAMIVPNTIVRADVAADFKAPFSDTSDYARAAPASDSARVAGNAHLLQGKDTTGFVRTDQAGSITSGMITDNNVTLSKIERGTHPDSGMALVSQGSGNNPVWGYPSAVGTAGTPVAFMKTGTFTFELPTIDSGAVHEDTVTIAGLEPGDLVFLSHPIAGGDWLSIQGLGNCQVTANDRLAFRVWNSSGSSVSPGQGIWRYVWIRQ